MKRLAVALLSCIWATPALAEPALRVCLQSNDPPLSSRRGTEPIGFDVELARLVAQRLDRPLAIQWFVTRDDPDSNPVTEANALLSDQRCELVAGYPLVTDKLGRPRTATGKLPPFEGATPEDRRRWIELGDLAPSVPYRFDAITVALAPSHAGTSVQSLHALQEFTIGVVVHGLPDLIAMAYHDGELADRVVHASQSNALFARLENGSLDAALVELRELDAWRVAHPTTPIIATGYTHSIGFNIGYVGLSTSRALLQRVDATVTDLLGQDGMPGLAAAAGMTWLPPRSSHIQAGTVLQSLRGD